MRRAYASWARTALVACAWSALVTMAEAGAAPLPIESVVGMKTLGLGSPMEFSPDGRYFAYVEESRHMGSSLDRPDVSLEDAGDRGIDSDIYVVDLSNHETRNVTRGIGENWSPAWSPDGRYLAFLSNRDHANDVGAWVWDVHTGDLRRVAGVGVRMTSQPIEWTPDSRQLLVTVATKKKVAKDPAKDPANDGVTVYRSQSEIRDEPGPERGSEDSGTLSLQWMCRDLAFLDVATGQVRILVSDKKIGTFRLFRDASSVVYTTALRLEKPGSQQVLFDLAVLDCSSGVERVLASGIRLDFGGNFSLSPDDSYVSYRANGQAEEAKNLYAIGLDKIGLNKLGLNNGRTRNLTHFSVPSGSGIQTKSQFPWSSVPLWGPEGNFVYFLTSGKLWQASVRNGNARELVTIEGHTITRLIGLSQSRLWTTGGGMTTVVITRNDATKEDGFYEIDLRNGRARRLRETGECYTCEGRFEGFYAVPDRAGKSVAYIAENAQRAADVWVSDLEFSHPMQLTHLNPEFGMYTMGTARLIHWLNDDGELLDGALVLPSDYKEGQRYPLMVLAYGGHSASNDLERFGGFERGMPYLNVQLLATRGYAVLMPDAPQHVGAPMLDLAKTILPGVNQVVEMGIADPARLGVMGHSYGGYTTLSLIVQTKRFKAAVEFNGFANILGFYGEMDQEGTAFGTSSETGQELVGGSPWEFRDRYIENSPIFYLDRVETPLLIVHGAEDHTIAPFLADEVFVGLRRLGKPVEYVNYHHEGHSIESYRDQLNVWQHTIRWLDRYLKSSQ